MKVSVIQTHFITLRVMKKRAASKAAKVKRKKKGHRESIV